MSKVLIYAGTTEGRQLATILWENGIPCIVSVATEYGKQVMPDLEGIDLRMGRLSREEMADIICQEQVTAVVDATHPFATEVSANIRRSVGRVPYIRLKRDTSHRQGHKISIYDNTQDCVEALRHSQGRILLTTGSKELDLFCQDETLRERLVVRVLPGSESIGLCEKAQIPGSRIIAMQGPFSKEMNVALIKQYDIKNMVTKESGRAGGLQEKLDGAEECGVRTFLIGNPDHSQGSSLGQVLDQLQELCHQPIEKRARLHITLAGIGLGDHKTLTQGARKAIEIADYIMGAKRLLESVGGSGKKIDSYLAKDILPELDRIKADNLCRECYVTILFSGDVGFYSGCTKMREELTKAGYKDVQVEPGISSIVYLSAKAGIPWQDGRLYSTHGKHLGQDNQNKGLLMELIKYNPYVHVITSGLEDLKIIGQMLEDMECHIWVGYNLSYRDEKIESIKPHQCRELENEGLYTLIICNEKPKTRPLGLSIRDEDFIRGKVPMTKEEVRTVSISKLGLCQGAVVYDVGSGTGSIAVEMAASSPSLRVYAIEQKQEAVELIRENSRKFNLDNIKVIEGEAPEVLENLEAPGYAFIGGSGGRLRDIIKLLYKKNNSMRVVVNAISLETIQETTAIIKEEIVPLADYQVVQMSVSRNRSVGTYELMTAENPVYIFAFTFKAQD